jgi:hypothetical protein
VTLSGVACRIVLTWNGVSRAELHRRRGVVGEPGTAYHDGAVTLKSVEAPVTLGRDPDE